MSTSDLKASSFYAAAAAAGDATSASGASGASGAPGVTRMASQHSPSSSGDASRALASFYQVDNNNSDASPASSPSSSSSALTEQQRRIKDIMGMFAEYHTDLSLNPHRVLIKEAKLARQATFKTVDRTVFLFNDCLLITDIVGGKGENANKLVQKQLLDLRAVVVEDAQATNKKANPNAFSVLTPERDFSFIASSVQAKNEWIQLIREASTAHKLTNAQSVLADTDPNAAKGRVFGAAVDENEGYEGRLLTVTLHSAVRDGKDDIVLHLLSEREEDPNQKDPEGSTALHIAIQHRNAFAVSLLIAHGADVNLTDAKNNTPLHLACANSDFATSMVLLSKQADASALDGEGHTPLWVLVLAEEKDGVAPGDVHASSSITSPSSSAAASASSASSSSSSSSTTESADVDESSGLQVDEEADQLYAQAMVDLVHMMLDKGAQLDVKDASGTPLFFHLCRLGRWRAVEAFLRNGYNHVLTNEKGHSPLHVAALSAVASPIDVASAAAATSTSSSSSSSSSLPKPAPATSASARVSYLKVVKLLLDQGAAPNARDNDMNTALHLTRSLAVAGCLIVHGARVDLKNAEGKRASEWFEERRHFINEHEFHNAEQAIKDAREAFAARPDTVLGENDVISEESSWTPDDAMNMCMMCAVPFSLTRRKSHCRKCGTLVCAQCSSKKFKRSAAAAAASTATAARSSKDKEEDLRCCDGCYNAMVEVQRKEARAKREQRRKELERQREEKVKFDEEIRLRDALFKAEREERESRLRDRVQQSQNARRERDVAANATESASASASQLQDQMHSNRRMLEERGERLNEMGDKGARLERQAEDFLEKARRIKEQQQKKSTWFGL